MTMRRETKCYCSKTPSQWYLAQFKPNCAKIAERNLARQGFGVFLPLERGTCVRGGRFLSVTKPFFPGYLFVSIDPASAPWRKIRSTQGISRLVCTGVQPTPVPARIIDQLMQRRDADGCMRPHVAIAEGDGVRINEGPLTNFVGRVERLSPDQRVWVLLEIMGKETRVSVRHDDLRLAS